MRRFLTSAILSLAACSEGALPETAPLTSSTRARYDADLAAVHLNYGHAEEAARLYREALALEGAPAEKALYHQGLAQALIALHAPAESQAELEKALRIYESLIHGSAVQASQFLERYVRLADRARARKLVDEVAAASSGKIDVPVLVWLANLYLVIDSPDEALSLYRRAEEAMADPLQKGRMALSRTALLMRLRKFEEAEATLQALTNHALPEIAAGAKASLVQCYASQGRLDKLQVIEKK